MVDTVLKIIGFTHLDIFKSEPVSRHCRYFMDGCTLRIQGMCARSEGPWKTARAVAQTLLVRLQPTYMHVPIYHPVAGWRPAYSLVLYGFLLWTSCAHTCVNYFVWFSPTFLFQGESKSKRFFCFILTLLVVNLIHVCANFWLYFPPPTTLAVSDRACFVDSFEIFRLWWTPHTFSDFDILNIHSLVCIQALLYCCQQVMYIVLWNRA